MSRIGEILDEPRAFPLSSVKVARGPSARRWWPTPNWGAVAVVVLGTAGASYVVSGSTFFADDYVNFAVAKSPGLSVSYLMTGVYGHLIPLYKLVNWALVTWAPYRFWAAALLELLFFLAGLLLVWRLLRLLFGTSWRTVLLLALFATAIFAVPPLLWWSSALGILPIIPLSALVIDAFVRYDLTRRRRHLVTIALAYTIGLGFFESMMLTLVLVVLLSLLYLHAGRGPRASLLETAKRWPAWLCFAVPTVLDLAYRFAHWSEFAPPTTPGAGEMLHYLGVAWSLGFMPGSLGLNYPGLLTSDVAAIVVGQAAFVVVVAVSIWRRREAWRAWVILAVVLLANFLPTGWTRVGVFGPDVGLDYRYLGYGPLLLVLTLGLAFLPLAVTSPETADAGAGQRAGAARPSAPRHRRRGPAPVVAVGLGALALAYLVAVAVSTDKLTTGSGSWAAASYLSRFSTSQAGVEARDPRAFLYDSTVPFVAAAFYPFNLYSYTVAKMDPGLPLQRVDGDGYVAAIDGEVVPATIAPVATGQLTPSTTVYGGRTVDVGGATCAQSGAGGDAGFYVELSHPLQATWQFMKVDYLLSRRAKVTISMGTKPNFLPAFPGLGPAVALGPGAGSVAGPLADYRAHTIAFTIPPEVTFCLTGLAVGQPVPASPPG